MMGFFLFGNASRPAMMPTQPPVQWVSGGFFPLVKRLYHKADHSLPSSAVVKYAWSYTSTPPTRPHGVVLN
jgi:hypothetical protein